MELLLTERTLCKSSLPLLPFLQLWRSSHREVAPTSCCACAAPQDGSQGAPASSLPTTEMPQADTFPDQHLSPHAVRVNPCKKHEKTQERNSGLFFSGFKMSVFKSIPVRASLRCSSGVKGDRVGENSLKKTPALEPQLLIPVTMWIFSLSTQG